MRHVAHAGSAPLQWKPLQSKIKGDTMKKLAFAVVAIGLLAASSAFADTPQLGRTVVDAKGKFVGYLMQNSVIEINADGVWVYVNQGIAPFGFAVAGAAFVQEYLKPNCSGQAYMTANDLPVQGVVTGTPVTLGYLAPTGILHAPGVPFKSVMIASAKPSNGVCMTPQSPSPDFVGPEVDVPLNFAAPFTVK
jgi:hypothetical protein